MIKRTPGLLAALALGSSAAFAQPAISIAAEPSIFSLETGHSMTVDAPGLTRVAVGDGRIAGVVPIGTTQVVINAKTSGHTTVLIWTGNTMREYEITVVSEGLQDFIKLVRSSIMITAPNSNLEIFSSGANVIVRGTVATADDYTRVGRVIAAFSSHDAVGGKEAAPGYQVSFCTRRKQRR